MGIGPLKERFVDIVGKLNVTNSLAQLKKNSTDATHIKSNPIMVVYPTNKQQVLEIINFANKENLKIVPRGGGSGLCGGTTANDSIVINLTRMKQIIRVNKSRKYVLIQPGIFLDKLNKKLNKYGLFFPVQPASHKIATLGGMISTNAGGEHVLRFGRMIDNILEMEVVTGDGRLMKVRGNKLKHFCGTEGLMGIVVEAKLKLLPEIKQKSITVGETDTVEGMMEIVKIAIKNKNLIACEFINPKVYKMTGFKEKYFLLLEYKGKGGKITNNREIRKSWKVRENCFDFLFKHRWKLIADPQLSVRRLYKFLKWCEEQNLPAFGHIGHGIIHVHFKNTAKMGKMYKLVTKLGGGITGEHGFGIIKKRYVPAKLKIKLKALKQVYNKNNILNPGKVI